MHEFKAVNEVVRKILAAEEPRIAEITLGELYGDADNFKKTVKELLKGTKAENVIISIKQTPLKVKCTCGFSGRIKVMDHIHFVRCPRCGKIAEIKSGDELVITIKH